MNDKIDFVILWVDGNDPEWQKEKAQYSQPKKEDINGSIRFRDWDNLKYWFRGVEKYANWVNKIYFITWGHLPEWLDVSNEKLVIVNHKDYIDQKYLPTYNSNVLDLNLKNIKNLSEKFVYFNDDFFIINQILPTDFFENNLPRDEFTESAIIPRDEEFTHNLLNNIIVVNKHYNKRIQFKKNIFKFINCKYGFKNNLKTLFLLPYENYIGIGNPHIPQAFIKSDFDRIWNLEYELCDNTSKNKFRTRFDITQYLIRNMRLVSGEFIPRSYKFGKYFRISHDNSQAIETIEKQKYKVICLNDGTTDIDFKKTKDEINKAFEKILPEKSSFEK